jgi:hypothetical protein
VPRLAAPTVLISCAASLLAAPSALALDLPAGAGGAPDLPPGVVVAEHPTLTSERGQGRDDLVAGAARANDERSDADDRPLWATVNICDTKGSPNALGVRTSVPGNGTSQRIFARYTAQWWSGEQQEWLTVGGSGVTDWIFVGDADMSSRQAGWTFRFVQPPQGTTYVMRAVVELQWREAAQTARRARKAGKARRARHARVRRQHATRGRRFLLNERRSGVVRERTLLTETGVKGVQGGDPAGLSKAMCLIW